MTAKIYLIRHGLAMEREEFTGDDDRQRPLTKEGEKKTARVAHRLRELDLSLDCLLTSPLVRARQTTDILQDYKLASRLEVVEFLAPGGDFGQGLTWLQSWQQSGGKAAGLVGHEPDLSQWAELLLWGEARGVLKLKKAGMIGLTLPEAGELVGNCQLFWLTAPGLLLGD